SFVGGVAAYLGTIMLSRKMAVVAGPLGHLALPGVAIAIIYGFSISLGAFPFVILGVVLIWLFEMRTKLPMEALTAIVFATGVATAFLFLPVDEAEAALVGNIMSVSYREAITSVALSAVVFLIVKLSYNKIMLINIYEDVAKIEGINIKLYNFLYLLSIAIVVAFGVNLVGGLMAAALVAIPSAASRNVSKSLRQYKFLASLFGAASAIIGITVSFSSKLPAGPLVILVGGAIFLVTVLFSKGS
ncbi:MAG: metal ABC transporter permease, partial [Candidatus Kryptoniota bacterium]